LDQATPPWRAFSSEAPDGAAPEVPAQPASRVSRWLAPALALVGGLLAGAAVVGLLMVVVGAMPTTSEALLLAEPTPDLSGMEPAMAAAAPARVVVDVAGAVAKPGLHRLHVGDRVGDAIEAAGGFAPRADLAAASQSLNLAQPLEDGAKVLVPELGVDRATTANAAAEDGRVDINRAGRSELESLPGIGPVTAGKIIDAREEARFGATRELRSRGLVGEKVYGDIKSLVRAD